MSADVPNSGGAVQKGECPPTPGERLPNSEALPYGALPAPDPYAGRLPPAAMGGHLLPAGGARGGGRGRGR
jgi:hypothetical protein